MPDFRDWTDDIKRWGESRDWKCLPRRHALQQFRAFCGWDVPEGFHVSDALHFGYNALMRASPEDRDGCHVYADLKRLQYAQEQADAAIRTLRRQQESEQRLLARNDLLAAVDAGHPVLVWRQGMYVEDVLNGKTVTGRTAFDELVTRFRESVRTVNNKLGVEECYIAAALLDSQGKMLTEHGIRVE